MKKLCMTSSLVILVLVMSGLSFADPMKGKGAQASIPENNPILMKLANGETPDQPGLINNPAFTASLNAMTPPAPEDFSQLDGALGQLSISGPAAVEFDQQPQPNAVPEPTTLLLVGVGILGLAGVHRARRA